METIPITVVKRNGKKVAFDGTKIAIAIKKGFDSIEAKYQAEDANKIYNKVISHLQNWQEPKIKIEQIQDIIEQELKSNHYDDVYESFSKYRERRAQSRESFVDEKKLHKFLKSIENLGFTSSIEDNLEKENSCAMETIFKFGSTVSQEFSKAYLMKKEFADSHDKGDIYIHDMDFFPMGTTNCCQIDLDKLFEDGFYTGNGKMREPQDIRSYTSLCSIAIQANQNDQHGEQSIPAFDFYLSSGVFKTFKKEFKQAIDDLLAFTNFDKFVALNGIEREINKLTTMDFDIAIFDKFTRDSVELQRLFRTAYQSAISKTNRITYQSMEAFIHNANTMASSAGAKVSTSSINLGTDTSAEGRMITKNFLLATEEGLGDKETPIFPISIFKVKDGINSSPNDPNYDLFQLACRVAKKRHLPHFAFLDTNFNKDLYKEGDFNTEVAYTGLSIRVLENVISLDKAITAGRGNLSITTINLPRLGIKYGINKERKQADMEAFFVDLDEKLELVKNQLLERFELQANKHVYNFPFLAGNGVWIDSEKLDNTDKLRRIIKHGTLSIGFIGLAECLKALTGKHHGESKKSQELGLQIISHMRQKIDEYSQKYNLNFSLIATPKGNISERFTQIDKTIYGLVHGITDKNAYTTSFQIPLEYNISNKDRIKIEAPYHNLTNGGHLSCITLSEQDDLASIEKIILQMKEAGIGYASFI